jgi:hypothetical protein
MKDVWYFLEIWIKSKRKLNESPSKEVAKVLV